jgi:very-short-patch-repair endonuclease
MPHNPRIHRARELRRDITPAESILWRELRGRRFADFKFRRQRSVGPYFADFYCHACRLIVELDGESHLEREDADRRRQDVLEAHGFKVVRFWNNWVYDDLEVVMNAIYEECVARARPKTHTPGPTPPKPGEGRKTP